LYQNTADPFFGLTTALICGKTVYPYESGASSFKNKNYLVDNIILKKKLKKPTKNIQVAILFPIEESNASLSVSLF
jgi:hypothetical protein